MSSTLLAKLVKKRLFLRIAASVSEVNTSFFHQNDFFVTVDQK